jgi:spermidine synthase
MRREIRDPKWWGSVDALQVDLYDHDAAAPVLDSAEPSMRTAGAC